MLFGYVTSIVNDDNELVVSVFTFCISFCLKYYQIGTCIAPHRRTPAHGCTLHTCLIFVTNLINNDYTHFNSLLYDDQKLDTTDTASTAFEYTFGSVNRVGIKLMRAKVDGKALKTISKHRLFTVAPGIVTALLAVADGGDDVWSRLQPSIKEKCNGKF